MQGLHATFMAKPIMAAAGSGMHIHQSLFDIKKKKNAFYDNNDRYKLSKVAYSFIAGQMKFIKAMCAILCPTVNSYKRLVSGFEAPVYVTWASMNRSALIRVPRWFERKPESARVELRCPDPTCNPYLAFACMCAAGLDGIKNKIMPADPVEEDIFEMTTAEKEKEGIIALPENLSIALDELERDKVLQKALGKHAYENFMLIKRKEWDEYRIQVTQWEIDRYLKYT